MASTDLLKGVHVVQFGCEPAIDFAGWVFAQNGAQVWVAEPSAEAGGGVGNEADEESVRTVREESAGEASARRRRFCGAGKAHVPREELQKKVSQATVVLARESYPWESVPATALTGTVTAFGDAGDYANWVPSEIALVSLGGASSYTHTADGIPVFGLGRRYQYLSGWLLYTALVARLASGQHVGSRRPDVVINLLESVVYMLPYATLQVAYNGSSETIEHSGPRFVVACRDGHVAVYAGSNWPGFADLLGRPDLRDDARFVTTGARFAHVDELERLLTAWCGQRDVADAEAAALRHSVAISRIATVPEVLRDDELRRVSMWERVDGEERGEAGGVGLERAGVGRTGSMPRLPYRIDGVRPGASRSRNAAGSAGTSATATTPPAAGAMQPTPATTAPTAGTASTAGTAPTATVRAPTAGVAAPAAEVTLPLSGLRVVDLTHVWSGPMATRVLGALGAEIVKIEGPTRPDFLRGAGATDIVRRYPELDPGADPGDRNAWFNTQNTDKDSVVLDLKSAEGHDIFLQLVARSDIVACNYRPGALERMGLGYEDLRRANPSIILLEMPGYASDGPMRGLAGYGAQFEARSGSSALMGSDDAPVLTGYALADPTAGLSAAAAVVTAVDRRRRTGTGARIELVQSEAMLPLIGDELLDASLGEDVTTPLNGDGHAWWQSIVRLADGSWLAIRLEDSRTVSAARQVLGLPEDADSTAIEQALADLPDAAKLAARLQDARVSAAPVASLSDVFHDQHLRAGDFYVRLDHPSTGRHDHAGFPGRLDGRRPGPRRPAPRFGADTRRILADTLQLDARQIDRIVAAGVVGTGHRQGDQAPETPSPEPLSPQPPSATTLSTDPLSTDPMSTPLPEEP